MKKIFTAAFALMLCGGALAADSVPWSEDFSEINAISKWPKKAVGNGSRSITLSSQQLQLSQAPTSAGRYNDYYLWFSTDGFDLTAGTSYRFDIDSKTNSTTGTFYYEILLYKKGASTPVYTDAHTTLMKVEDLVADFSTNSCYFEPAETGEYYLCLHAYADNKARAMYWDNFKLVEASMSAPDKPGLAVTPDPTGILKATVDVTCPTQNIRGESITSLTKLMIYRDGGLIKEVETPAVGSKITLVDYVAQPGSHRYSAVAYNEYKAGAQRDLDVTVGSEVQTATWLYKAMYTPEGNMKIQWPDKEGVTEWQVATVSGRVVTGTPVKDEETGNWSVVDEGFELGSEPNGWQYTVSQVKEDDTTTVLGTTNYLALNNKIPYYPVLTMQTALNGFTLDHDYQYGWQFFSNGGGSVGTGISRDYTTKEMYNQWLISPGINLSKDKFYRVKITGGCDYGGVTYTVKVGKGNYREALDILVAEDKPMVKSGSNLPVTQTDEMFLSVPEDGMYFVGLVGKIPGASSSDYIRLKRFDIIEVDGTLPDTPTDVVVSYSATGSSDGTISFKVPTKAINGTDVEGLARIEILKDGEPYRTITEGVTPGAALSFDIEVNAGEQNVYSIMAFNGAGQGESAVVKVLVLSTPYTNDFSSKKALEGYTLINNTDTHNTFEVFNDRVRLWPDDAGSDHWLITPPITLQTGMYYILNFNVKGKSDECGDVDVMLGKAPEPSMLTQRVMETIDIDKADNIYMGNREEYFTVDENGQYFLAFHFTRPAGRDLDAEVYFDELSISAGVNGVQPDRGHLEVIPASDGSLKAELNYTAATHSLNGTALNANSTQDVYFYINGVQTPSGRTFKAYPGQKVAITVEVPEDLPYIFSARTGWAGRPSYQDAFVGINRPSYPDPSSIKLKETSPWGHVQMSWDAPTKDYEGYPLNPDLLTYDVSLLKADMYGNPYEEEVLKNVKGTVCEFDAIAPDAAQTMKRYVLRARNSKGEGSSGVITGYVNVGKPYRMPYRESFARDNGAAGATTAIFDEALEGMCRWGIMTDGLEGIKSADGDGAYIALESVFIDSKGLLYTGKVNLGSGQHPAMTLMVYNHGSGERRDENLVEFKVYSYNDNKWHSLGEPRAVADLCNGRPGWNKVTVDLSDYIDNIVICGIEATCKIFTFTSFDNIRIWELPANDLSLQKHNAPISVSPGATFNVDVTVANSGLNASTPDSVEMCVDGNTVAKVDGVEIAPGKSAVFSFTHSFPAVDLATSHEVVFKVNHEADNDLSDNESVPVTIFTIDNSLAGVENLKASHDDDLVVTLSWDAPAASEVTGTVTEDFESWQQGVASQKGWTSFDYDGRAILGINDGTGNPIVLPGLTSNEPASFGVIDNVEGNLPASAFPAKSGQKFLMSICPGGSTGSADDWMISPELSGNAQTIKVNVLNFKGYPAGYQVLCSDGDMSIEGFKSVGVNTVNESDWREDSFDLPEGTRRVAIRNISNCDSSFMLMIDDITYEPASGDAVKLIGYNVYQESECLASPVAPSTSFTILEPMAEGTYIFGVSACYANGESKVTPVEITVKDNGVEYTEATGVHVFGGTGCIHVTGAEGMTVAVYDIEGRTLCNGRISDDGRIAAAAGIYVVAVDGKSFKVIVK